MFRGMKPVMIAKRAIVAATLLLAGCADDDSTASRGGVSVEDAKALDEAAAKLDAETPAAEETGRPADGK